MSEPDGAPERGRLMVTGIGRVAVAPDVADLQLGIALVRPTVARARADAVSIQAGVLQAFLDAGIEARDVQTMDLALHPRYDHRDGGAVLTGYELSNQVRITIRDLARVGEVIDGALGAGATSMDGLAFRLADPGPAETSARRAAVAAAQAAAATLAEAAGVILDGVVDLVEGGGGIPRPFAAKAERMVAADTGTPVEAGTTEVVVTVTVTFATRPRASSSSED
jgi:uncharacterized protein YggE